jgi:ketosteroid isomerase-like protein
MHKPLVSDVFSLVDSGDARAFSQLFSENGRMRFGNWDTRVGRQTIEQGISQFFQTIKGLHHNVTNEWVIGEDHIAELSVTYDRLDGAQATIPVVTMWRTGDDNLIEDYRVFLDLTPVFA